MNQPNNREANGQTFLIDDLTVTNDQAADVKGGPIEIKELHIRVTAPNP